LNWPVALLGDESEGMKAKIPGDFPPTVGGTVDIITRAQLPRRRLQHPTTQSVV
jgi:hypothetical protein